VFVRPSVARTVESYFVPVKINIDQHPELAKRYGVRQIPYDVIITPSGQVVGQTISPASPQGYSSKLVQIARRAGVQPPQTLLAGSPRPATRQRPPGVAAAPGPSVPAASRPMGFPGAGAAGAVVPPQPRYAQATVAGTAAASAGPSLRAPAGTPPTAAGRSRLPWPLAPVLSGYDVVSYLEQGHLVPGKRRHGVFYQGRIYLFANEQTLRKFELQPERYAPEVLRRVAMMDQWGRSQRRCGPVGPLAAAVTGRSPSAPTRTHAT